MAAITFVGESASHSELVLASTSAFFPDDLAVVSYEDIVRVVERLEFEPGPVDFKEVLNPTGQGRGDAVLSLRRTVCAMANSAGGWIVFGVRDRATGVATRDRVVGIPLGADLRHEFGQKLVGILPEVHFETNPAPIGIPGSSAGLFVARIPVSALRPHMVSETGIFYRRGDGGAAEPMGYFHVRDQMLLTEERLRKVNLLRLDIAIQLQVSALIRESAPTRPIMVALRLDTSGFKSLVADVVTVLPAEPDLIQKLLAIPVQAAVANHYMELANNPVTFSLTGRDRLLESSEASLLVVLAALDEICNAAEKRLGEAFGPLPFAPSEPPDT